MLSHAARRSCGHLRSQSVRRTARGVAERAGTRVAPAPSSAGTAEAAGKAAGMVAVQVLPGSAKAVTNDQAPGEWLQSGPRGAYTVARTVGLTSVFELDFHVQRLAKSASLMLEGDGAAAPAGSELEACCDAARLHTRIVDAWGECVRAMGPSGAKELKLSALLSWDVATGAAELRAHAAPLPSRPPHPVRAIVRGAPRSNAEAKDSAWIAARAGLDAVGKAAGANEVVLVDGNGDLLEGLSSNFYAVEADGALVTAEEGVLKGTVRDVALRACEREGVPVRLRPPRLADARSWKGCLVSSTSRLALPVDELVYEVAASGEEVTVKFDYSSETGDDTALKVEALVLGDMAANSQPVIE